MTGATSAGAGLELLVLGAGPAYSDIPGDLGSGFLVRTAGDRDAGGGVVLDLGQGTFNPLAVAVEPSSLAAVAISHLHPDHFIDLVPLRHYLTRREFQPPRRLRLIAPAGLSERLDAVYDDVGFTGAAFDLVELPDGEAAMTVGPFVLGSRRVRHAGESRAYRVSRDDARGPGIVYSGDVADVDDLRPLIRPGDLLVSEATFGPGPVPAGMPHIDSGMAGRLARATGVAQLVLVHLRMGTDPAATLEAARAVYPGPVVIGRPGDRFDV